jgi:acyl-CoA synthetase (AMP-forming)/AMP-acid ligase II
MTTLLTLAESVATHARTQPHKIGARDSKRALSWAEWNERASRLANALLGLGLQPGDRVALLAYNCIEWLEIYAALARAGLVAVPINFRLKGPEVAYIVQHAEAQALVCQEALRALVDGIRDELPIAAARYVHFGADITPAGWQGYEALIAAASAAAPAVQVRPEDLFALMYTSGTTGRPKGAMRSHEGNALIALVTALEFGLTRDDTGLLVMPLCHANSLYFGVTFAMLGATIVVDDRRSFDPEAVLRTLAREQVTFTSLVPTHYIMMLDLPEAVKQGLDLSRVGKLLISSAPARRETKLGILRLFPNGRLFELYGSTEAGWVTILRPDEQLEHLGSVGREWAGSGPIRLLDGDGREVPDGEVGELYSRTAYAFDGYWKNPEKTREAFWLPPRPGRAGSAPRGGAASAGRPGTFHGAWCSVGDMARRDEHGFIHLVDRKSNMIISGGENIYPSEVETVLAAHPAVQDVAVVGLPDAKWGEAVHAVIVLRPGQAADAKAMEDWCRERMAGFKRPRGYRFVAESELPRTATGKIQHRILRDRLAAQGRAYAG